MIDETNLTALLGDLQGQQAQLSSAIKNGLDAMSGIVRAIEMQEERIRVLESIVTYQGREIAKLREANGLG